MHKDSGRLLYVNQAEARRSEKICFFNYKSGAYRSNIRLFAINHIFLFLYNYGRI